MTERVNKHLCHGSLMAGRSSMLCFVRQSHYTGSGLLLSTLDSFLLSCLIIKHRNHKENNVRTWKKNNKASFCLNSSIFIYYMYECVSMCRCTHMSICTYSACLQRPEEGISSPGAGANTDVCEPLNKHLH